MCLQTYYIYYTNSTTVTLHTILPAYYAFYNVLRFFPCKNVCFVVPTKTQTVRERILLGVCLLRRRFWYYFCVYFFLLLVSLIVHPALYRNNFCLYILLRLLFGASSKKKASCVLVHVCVFGWTKNQLLFTLRSYIVCSLYHHHRRHRHHSQI